MFLWFFFNLSRFVLFSVSTHKHGKAHFDIETIRNCHALFWIMSIDDGQLSSLSLNKYLTVSRVVNKDFLIYLAISCHCCAFQKERKKFGFEYQAK